MKKTYVERRFSKASMALIIQAIDIVEEYQAQGYSLTLRQLYYQFVSRDLIANSMAEYKRLGSVINDARLAGLISWAAIEDRTRNLQRLSTWENPGQIVRACADQYRIDLWDSQDYYIEVWIEKDALAGVIEGVCHEYRVPFFACKGYTSQSEQWSAGQRLIKRIQRGQYVVVLHLGDHDPSGIDMTRDNNDRLKMFIAADADPNMFEIRRLALNMEQIKQYKPPPNPAKFTDSRASGYVKKFGVSSWELDALEPKVLSALIGDNIQTLINYQNWAAMLEQEKQAQNTLQELADTLR